MLNENNEILAENIKTVKTFNSYFESIIDSPKLFASSVKYSYDKVHNNLKTFSNRSSILKIKQKFKLDKKFSFQCVSESTVKKVEKNLLLDKVTAGEIPVKVLKNSEICFFELTHCINEAIRNNKFPDFLKLADITPVYKT